MTQKKLFYWKIFWVLFLTYSFVMPIARSVNRKLPDELPILSTLKDISPIDQFGRSFPLSDRVKIVINNYKDLNQKEWELLQLIQKRTKGVASKLFIVSLTNLDQDARLEIANLKKANPFVWKFVQQDPNTVIEWKKPIQLVDAKGNVRRDYEISQYDINLLMIDVGLLINREQFAQPLLSIIKESFKK